MKKINEISLTLIKSLKQYTQLQSDHTSFHAAP